MTTYSVGTRAQISMDRLLQFSNVIWINETKFARI
jgi:hypothetical protein